MAETKNLTVELVCKAEGLIVIADITTSGSLDAASIKAGLSGRDKRRCPLDKNILQGTIMSCNRCHEPLYFRAQDGELFAATPGELKAK